MLAPKFSNGENVAHSVASEGLELMKEMFRDVIQQVMEVEMDEELGRERCQRSEEPEGTPRNYRNGHSRKSIKTQLGKIDVKIPRDRNGAFEPKIIGKYDRNADGIEEKILSLYACGMSQRDISEQIEALYDVEISPELVTKISEKIMPEVTAWQNRPLEQVYPFIFMDAITNNYAIKWLTKVCLKNTKCKFSEYDSLLSEAPLIKLNRDVAFDKVRTQRIENSAYL